MGKFSEGGPEGLYDHSWKQNTDHLLSVMTLGEKFDLTLRISELRL